MTGNKPCSPGCTCRKHRVGPRPVCPEGCTCNRHNKARKVNWDDLDARRTYQRERARQKYATNPEAAREAARRWASANRHYGKYRLTNAAWQELLSTQDGACYLCVRPLDTRGGSRAIHVDHDHTCCTGERTCGKCIRGLACRSCNQGIGAFRDDPERMRRVAENLRIAKARLTHL